MSLQLFIVFMIIVQTTLAAKKCGYKTEASAADVSKATGIYGGFQHYDAASQLLNFLKSKPHIDRKKTSCGVPASSKTSPLTTARRGHMLLQDLVYMDELSYFERKHIPVRVVHTKGVGAFVYFEVTKDITQYIKVFNFSKIQTPRFVRFSTVCMFFYLLFKFISSF